MAHHDDELHVRLRDGTPALIRPIRPDDKERLRAGFERLSSRSRYLRFHAPIEKLTDEQLKYFTEIDYKDHMAWVAIDEDHPDEPGMGVARYVRLADEPTVAEAALTVVDHYQGRGLATVLLGVLGRSAIDNGITTFRNYVLAGNEEMLELFTQLGAVVTEEDAGILSVDYPLPDDPDRLPDTPAGRVIREVTKDPRRLSFGPPVWIGDESDQEHPLPGKERGLFRDWLDEMLGDLES